MLEFSFSQQELDAYWEDGYLIRQSVFSKDEVETLVTAAEQAENHALALSKLGKTYILDGKRFVDSGKVTIQYEAESDKIKVIEPVHGLHPVLADLVKDSRIVHPMACILKTKNIALWTDKLNLKGPNGSGFGWHQDSPYWIHDSNHVDLLPNVLVTFDKANIENGCLRVIKGSHNKGCLPGKEDGTQLAGFYTNENCFSESNSVNMLAPAGSLIFFNPHAIHGSLPNHSKADRRAMVITYQPGGFPSLKSKEIYPVSYF